MTAPVPLHVRLFGTLRLSLGGERLADFPTEKSRNLFCYLAVNRRRSHARSVLAGVFWGDLPESVARKRLRTELWRVRSVVEPERALRGSVVRADHRDIGFEVGEGGWVDVEEFEACLRSLPVHAKELETESVESLMRAVTLYQGDLLEGVYDDWCVYERERLRSMYYLALHRLIAHHAGRGEWSRAIVVSRELLARDPLQEQAHRNLMRFHYLAGNRPAALEQFGVVSRLLMRELEVEPMEETVALYRAVLDDRCDLVLDPSRPPSVADPRGPTPRALVDDLDQASLELQEISHRLRRGIMELERRPGRNKFRSPA